jgi:hypothetical protein
MLKQLDRILGGCLCALLLSCGLAGAYDYPFADPYAATVVGTPTEYMEALPADVPVKFDTLKMFPERDVPGILWNFEELRYSYIRQKDPSPLIFLIAGTGAGFNSPKMQLMQKAFYRAGYHVISISSPTHPNFIVAASTSGVPGHLEEDSADLYKVMQAIWQKHQKKMEVTDFYLTGYSLGAAQSAFIARLDEQEQAFNFRKVLLINPPVSLYNSVLILDEMLEHNIPGGLDNFNAFYQRIVNAFADVYAHGEDVQFNNDFLYRAYEYRKPSSDEPLAALIGTSFRISSQNMVFTTDVLTKAGYVVPKNLVLRRHDNVRDYAKVLAQLSFLDYFRGIFVPHFQAQDPSVTEAQLIKTLSLRSLDEYLRNSEKFGLIGNEDDVILLPGEIDYLRDLFGSRATIFPHGGHCGNMAYPDNVSAMVGFFADAKN